MTPRQEARGIITPSSLHYELHHGGVPTIDPTQHTLLIRGLVKLPLKLTVHDLMRFPSINRIAFSEMLRQRFPGMAAAHGQGCATDPRLAERHG